MQWREISSDDDTATLIALFPECALVTTYSQDWYRRDDNGPTSAYIEISAWYPPGEYDGETHVDMHEVLIMTKPFTLRHDQRNSRHNNPIWQTILHQPAELIYRAWKNTLNIDNALEAQSGSAHLS